MVVHYCHLRFTAFVEDGGTRTGIDHSRPGVNEHDNQISGRVISRHGNGQ